MKHLFMILLTAAAVIANAQNLPVLQAQKCLGGGSNDLAKIIQQTKDGGCIVAGYSFSNDGDVSGNHGNLYPDCWIVKLSNRGAIQWQKCLGGSGDDEANSIQQTKDGGYIVAGFTLSNDGDVSGNHGFSDYWVVKLNSTGAIQWQKCLGGNSWERAQSVQQTADGGYIVAGNSNSNDGNVSGNHGTDDFWIVKLSNAGAIQWQKCLGGSDGETPYSIQQTTDGGYIVAGFTLSNDGDVSGNHGYFDYWIVKLNSAGAIQWQKCLGGTGVYDIAYSIQQTADEGYIVAGETSSNNGDVSGNHGFGDYWVVKLTGAGIIQWQKCLGGSDCDKAYSIRQTTDGGYIVAGSTGSKDGDVSNKHGRADYWVVKLTGAGVIEWQKCLGGNMNDNAYSIEQTTDGGYIVAGVSDSNNGDVYGNHGGDDYWLVKLSASGNLISQLPNNNSSFIIQNSSFRISPNPVQSILRITGLSAIKNYELRIMNESGTVVLNAQVKNISSYDIDVNRLAAGIYYLQAGEEKVKFVKE